jgi:FkbM family methyltransferase
MLSNIEKWLPKKALLYYYQLQSNNGKLVKKLARFTMELDINEYIDQTILKYGFFEAVTTEWITKSLREGDVMVDVGANIGYMSLVGRAAVGTKGTVWAIEPTQYAYQKLQRNIALNQWTNIKAVKMAFSTFTQAQVDITFNPTEYLTGSQNSMRSSWALEKNKIGTQQQDKDYCDFMPLDDFVEKNNITKINLLKIDVDGHEKSVLLGGLKTIKKFLPKIILEIDWTRNLDEQQTFSKELSNLFEELFTQYNYVAHAENRGSFHTLNDFLTYLQECSQTGTSPNFLFSSPSRG